MAARATDPPVNMRRVIIENVIGRPMDLDPLNGLPALPTRPDGFQFRILFLHLGVARHTRLRIWQIRVRRNINEAVAITAIHSQLRDVHIMRERHRLHRFISHPRIFRRDVIPRRPGQTAYHQNSADRYLQRKPV